MDFFFLFDLGLCCTVGYHFLEIKNVDNIVLNFRIFIAE
jgi:hypothetical protein